jgi:hypothetical protein
MPPWSIADTRNLVAQLHGEERLSRLAPSLYAMSQRQSYARYHYQEAMRLLNDFKGSHLNDHDLLHVLHGPEESSRAAFERFLMQAGAHVLACVLSVDSMADVIAYAIYVALKYENQPGLRKSRAVSASSIEPLLRKTAAHAILADSLSQLTASNHFQHVAALANTSKHRGLIRSSLNEDWTGERERPYELRFASFEYEGKQYPNGEVSEVIGPAYEQASAVTVKVGNDLNRILTQSAA